MAINFNGVRIKPASGGAGGGVSWPGDGTKLLAGDGSQVVVGDGLDLSAGTLTAGGWQTVLDIDFTTQAAQTFSTDGTYTIAGKTFTKGNSSADSTAAALVPSEGLKFMPNAGSDYNGSTRGMPYLWTPLNGILPADLAYSWSSRIRLYVSLGSNNISANFDNFVLGLDTNSTTWGIIIKLGYGTGGTNPTTAMFWDINGTGGSVAGNGTTFLNGSNSYSLGAGGIRTFCFEFGSVNNSGPAFTNVMEYRNGSMNPGDAFPSIKTFSPGLSCSLRNYAQLQDWSSTAQGFNSHGSPYMSGGPWESLGILLGMQRAGGTAGLHGRYQRVRLDVLV